MDIYAWMRVLVQSGYGRPDKDNSLIGSIERIYQQLVSSEVRLESAKNTLLKEMDKYPKIKEILKDEIQDKTDFESFHEAISYVKTTSNILDSIPRSEEIMNQVRTQLATSDPENFLLKADKIGYGKYQEYEAKGADELVKRVVENRLRVKEVDKSKMEEIMKILKETGTIRRVGACLQEFERRAGQKRKARVGGELEQSIQFLLDSHGIEHQPASYVGHAEFDRGIPLEDGRVALISCKRTTRERWKEVVVTGKNIIIQISIGEDITYGKAQAMRDAGVRLYTRSDTAKTLSESGLDNIRSLSDLIKDLKEEFKAKKKQKQEKLF